MKALVTLALLLLATSALGIEVRIRWDANKESDLLKYLVYQSAFKNMSAPIKIAETTATTAAISNVRAGEPYYFAVTAVNVSGVESSYSNIVYFQQPLPPSSLQLIVNQLVIQ